MPLINFKINIKLTRGESCKLASALRTAANFKIKDVELFAPLVILSNKDNVKLAKQWSDIFNVSADLNKYEMTPNKVATRNTKV